MRGDGYDEAPGVDEEHGHVDRDKDDGPPRGEDEEAQAVAVRAVRVGRVASSVGKKPGKVESREGEGRGVRGWCQRERGVRGGMGERGEIEVREKREEEGGGK